MGNLDSQQPDERTPDELIEKIISPALLDLINQTKRDYNAASSAHEHEGTRIILMKEYADMICRGGGILEHVSDEVKAAIQSLPQDTLWEHPLLKRIREDKNGVTILWLELFKREFWTEDVKFQQRVREKLSAETDVWHRIRGRA